MQTASKSFLVLMQVVVIVVRGVALANGQYCS